MTATATIKLPKLYAKQRAALFCKERYGVVEASTKSGKTVGCMAWIVGQAVQTGSDGRNYWWVAPIFPQAKIAFRRIARMLRRADPNKDFWTDNKSELTITLANGATIWFKGGDDPDSLYGEDVYGAVIDEASRVKEDSWFAVRSTLTATRAPVRIIGNVKGRKNWAYQIARKAQSGEPDMHYSKITAYDAIAAGVLHESEIEDAKRQLPPDVFKELYLAEPSEDQGNPFGIAAIRACMGEMSKPPVAWWGIDLARGRKVTHDWTVAVGFDNTGRVAGFQRWQADWHSTKHRIRAMVKGTPAMIDATGVGDSIVEEIQRDCPNVQAFVFTAKSKQILMEGLAFAIQNKTITYPDGPIVQELESFEYEVRVVNGRVTNVAYSAPVGLHDDCVCALALAVECRRVSPKPMELSLITTVEDNEYKWESGYDPIDDDRMWTNQ